MLDVFNQSVDQLMMEFRSINQSVELDEAVKPKFIRFFQKLMDHQSLMSEEVADFMKQTEEKTELHGRSSQYEVLYKSSLLLNSSLDLDDILDMAIDALINMTGAGRGFLATLDQKGNYKQLVSRNTEEADLDRKKRELSDTIIKRMLSSEKSIALEQGDFDQELMEQSSIQRLGQEATICTPLFIKSELKAMIYLDQFKSIDIKKVELVKAFSEQISLVLQQSDLFSNLKSENKKLLDELRNRYEFDHIIGKSPKMIEILKMVSRVSDTSATVLIQGESGTGKDLIAKALHCNSSRKDENFVQVDCGALPATLIESELFGHKKGAFTGAQTEKVGLLEAADGGTIFLDELNNMPMDTQSKLLRALQSKSVRRVGETIERKSDFRLIVASSRDLRKEMEAGRFREDLFYRIYTICIDLPSLRERKEDILELTYFFLKRYSDLYKRNDLKLTSEFVRHIENYRWAGNVRELEHAIERAIILAEGNELSVDDLPQEIVSEIESSLITNTSHTLEEFVNKAKKKYVTQILKECDGKKTEAAKRLGIDRSYLFTLSKKLEIQ